MELNLILRLEHEYCHSSYDKSVLQRFFNLQPAVNDVRPLHVSLFIRMSGSSPIVAWEIRSDFGEFTISSLTDHLLTLS